MLFLIIPPLTPILKNVKHLVVSCEPILIVNIPPQSLVLKITDQESCILVTNKIKVIHKAVAAHKVRVKYMAKVTYKAKQVKGYPGFLKSPGLVITDKNISKPFLTLVSFSLHV
jgi:hypothetical protein